MSQEEYARCELDRADLAVLQNALFDYENYLISSRAGRSGASWAARDIERIKQMREAVSRLQRNPDSMPLLLDANSDI